MKKWLCACFSLLILISLCACGGQEIPAGTKTVCDMVGREVSVTPGSYKRVVCVGAGAFRMYCYVGDVSLLAGVEDIDNVSLSSRPKMFDGVARPYVLAFGETFKTLPSCGVGGPMAQAAEVEKILACDPDIVISEFEDKDKSDALQQQLGVPVITLRASSNVFDENFAGSLRLLGKVFDKEARASSLCQYVASEKAAIENRVAQISDSEKPSVYICGLGNWGTADHLTTAENYPSFQVAGIKNAFSGLGMTGVGTIEEEKFVDLGAQMDIMILDAAAVKNIKPLYDEDPTMFDTCKAWQNGEVYLEMAYNAYYTNYEISLINTWFVAKAVYPELFADVDMTAKTNAVTKMFLGAELAEEIFACGSSFGGYQKIDTENFFK
jgi:iron complex transport system substrate-binding protein